MMAVVMAVMVMSGDRGTPNLPQSKEVGLANGLLLLTGSGM
jgi:hypothetical protein